MNLELLDPWEQEYPQLIEETLEDGYVLCCKFNKRGTLLGAGCLDGRCIIWDFDTKGVSRSLVGHVKPVSSISWSRNGKYLLSASKDWTCIYWDLMSGKKKLKIRFDTPVLMAHMHPKNNHRFVAVLFQDNPVVVDILGEDIVKTVLPTEPDLKEEKPKNAFFVTAIAWNKAGTKIYAGTSKGYLNIIDVETNKIIYSTRITNTTIKGIQWSRNGRDLLVNANDRSIRYYQIEDEESGIPVFRNRFQDLVNRVQWSQTCFSADGEFVIGGSGHKAEHNIYIWDKNIGNLVKILEGPKEPLDDLAWHPVKPVIGSVSSFGNIYIWATKHEENWSAFAPDFIELEENLEYEEKEDEFDVVPDDEKSKQKQVDEDVLVDVTTCDAIQAFIESSDEEDEVFYLPTLAFEDDDKNLSSDEEYAKKSLKKHGSELLKKKKKLDSDETFKVHYHFSSTRLAIYYQSERQAEATRLMTTLADDLIRLNSLPYVSLCDDMNIISVEYSDFNTCEIDYQYTKTIQRSTSIITSPPVSIKSHQWHSGSWNQDQSFLSATRTTRFLSSPSLFSAPQFRSSASYPDRPFVSPQWDTLHQDEEIEKSRELRIKTMDFSNLKISLPQHEAWSDKFIQRCVQCSRVKNGCIIQILHPPQLMQYLEENNPEETLQVKITLTRSDRDRFTVNDTDWPMQILNYDSQSDEDSSMNDSGSEKDPDEEDIFVDGMEELEETNYDPDICHQPLLNPTSNRLTLPAKDLSLPLSTTPDHSIPSIPTLNETSKQDQLSPTIKPMPTGQPIKEFNSSSNLIEQEEKPKTTKSKSLDRKPTMMSIPESDPVALQKAYPVFNKYIKPDSMKIPIHLVQSPCRDNDYVAIKKLDIPEHPMGAFLVESVWKECSVWDVKAVVESVGARKVWDNTFETSTLLHALTPSSSIWHTKIRGAWPVSSRDYVCFQGQYTSPYTIDLLSTSCIGESYQHKSLPKEISGYIRATMDVAGWRIERLDRRTVSVKSVLMTQFSTWVINYITSRYLEQSLAAVQMAKEYLDLHGAPPSLENLTNAMLVNLKHDHDRKTWRCEYSRRTDADSGDKDAKTTSNVSTTSLIRIDRRRWATQNRYTIIIDPPPSGVRAVQQAHDPYGVWLTVEHDEVFIIPFHGKILAIIKPDDAVARDPGSDADCHIVVNGGPIAIEQEQKLPEAEEDVAGPEEKLIKTAVQETPSVSEEEAVIRAVDSLSLTPSKHVQAALALLKQADEQFGWTVISDKNGFKISKRPGTKTKKKDHEPSFVSLEDLSLLDVPDPFMIYKASKVIEHYSAEEITAIVSDTQSVRKAYDDTIEQLDVLRHVEPGYNIIRMSIKAIFPFKPREVYACSCLTQIPSPSAADSQIKRTIYFESSIPGFPIISTKKPRGNLLMSAWIIEPIDPYTTATNHPIPSTRVTCVAALDLGNSVPSYISNLVVNNWFPKKIQAIQSYLKSNGAPPFLSEPVSSFSECPDKGFRWEKIDATYDKNSHHYKLSSHLKVLCSDFAAPSSKRSGMLSRKVSTETVNTTLDKANRDSDSVDSSTPRSPYLQAVDRTAQRRGSLSTNSLLPKKRMSENKERSVGSSRMFTFLRITFDLRSFAKGYEIQVQLFDTTDKKRNISDKLTMQISEPVLTHLTKNDLIKHSIHVTTTPHLSPSVLPASFEFEFSLRPILEDAVENRETRLTVSHVLGEDNEEDPKATWKGTIVVNGDRAEIGKDIKIKACIQDEEKVDESSSHAEISEIQGHGIKNTQEDENQSEIGRESSESADGETGEVSTLAHYTSGGVVATALGNVSAGVNNIGARMMFPFRAASSRSLLSNEYRSEPLTSNDLNSTCMMDGSPKETGDLVESGGHYEHHEPPALRLREIRVLANSRNMTHRNLFLMYILKGLAVILILVILRYAVGRYLLANISILEDSANQKDAHLLLQIPWFKGWNLQLTAVKSTRDI
ncbi:hypothetical protein G6F45_005646 [Rhizopus arrhizus]|uniref:START domain-containing protein n=1 Tax=Rhizopus oryzae TaxID=64495 RepID=A0A9P6YD51_RHIOR|nr:hypothetical protein G6F51_005498 [Rhizopus arrhizus]KAG1630229.1 hypothetical protein G6F45_005646 [Rhizopus arrhizus]KAG1640212.1 hypothetical protein G6F44_007058 [Rhizopus delemar]